MTWRPNSTPEMARARASMRERAHRFFRARDVLEVTTPALAATSTPDVNIESIRAVAGGREGARHGTLHAGAQPVYFRTMASNNRLMDMLTGYAAAHQHPFNIFVHMIGIPTIMLGVLIPLTWARVEIGSMTFSLAHVVLLGFFLFYLTLDGVFAIVFLAAGTLLTIAATTIGELPLPVSGGIAAGCFFGGYAAQFIGHAVEKYSSSTRSRPTWPRRFSRLSSCSS